MGANTLNCYCRRGATGYTGNDVYDHECWLANDTMPWADEVWPNVTHVRTTTTTLRAAIEETPLSAVIGVAAQHRAYGEQQ